MPDPVWAVVRSVKHLTLATLALLFMLVQGTTHAWVWTALALAAIRSDWRRGPRYGSASCTTARLPTP
jgi:hypothetical protein